MTQMDADVADRPSSEPASVHRSRPATIEVFESSLCAVDPNYAPWIYGCALLFAAIPLTTGDTVWSILVLPLALGTAAMIVARRQKKK